MDCDSRHLNHMMVRVLKTIGFDVRFVSGKGAYLKDASGARYLDLVSGWGVFVIGRNHPRVAAALGLCSTANCPISFKWTYRRSPAFSPSGC